ncbi:hypothetical protein AAF712_004989 [Marasmius tenuissimus]|uniref:Uncharacterized protein n=1 Tax=Marasmius tenuissimus TaxID=585030 RepID=A0ABR3A1E7_9AGAR
MSLKFKTIALFEANGQIGDSILQALLECEKREFTILAFIPPDCELESGKSDPRATVKEFDLDTISKDVLVGELQGVDVVISALNGKALEAEYGMHIIYRKPEDPQGYIHPIWDVKARHNEDAVLHPAVPEGRMTYTIIGCGDFYNQDREKVWCPWTQKDVDEYTLHIVGNPYAKAQYTHLGDLAKYLVATLLEPEKSENQCLNFPSDTITSNEIAELLEKYSGKPVKLDVISSDNVHEVVADPSRAAKGLGDSAFPVDFWYLVKGFQGQGRFRSTFSILEQNTQAARRWLYRQLGSFYHLTRNNALILSAVVKMRGADEPSRIPQTLFAFNSPEDVQMMATGCDADIGGNSTVHFDLDTSPIHNQPIGKPATARFWGNMRLDVQPKFRGRVRGGYAAFRNKSRRTLFGEMLENIEFHEYLALRVRLGGDPSTHNSYFVNLQTNGPISTDLWQHRLYCQRRDNRWEDVFIPFRNFVRTNNGELSEINITMSDKLRSVGISLLGGNSGASGDYELGIDSIRIVNEEDLVSDLVDEKDRSQDAPKEKDGWQDL